MLVSSVILAAGARLRRYASFLKSTDFDEIMWRFQAKTRGLDFGFVSVENLGSDVSRAKYYSDTGGKLRFVLKALAPSRLDEAIDIGCGKAGAVLTLAKYFARADGIDISEALIETGRENLRRMRIKNSSLFTCDAVEFRDLDRYGFIYFFNPFPRAVMEGTIRNIVASLTRRPRRIEILYYNPVDGDLLEKAGFQRSRGIRPNEAAKHKGNRETWGAFVMYSWRNQ